MKSRTRTLLLALIGLILVAVAAQRTGAATYLSDRPEACRRCHLMESRFASWHASRHAKTTTCSDCHAPQGWEGPAFKAMSGLRHAAITTARAEPPTVYVADAGFAILQNNCLRCHHEKVPPGTPPPPEGTRTRPRPDTAFHADPGRTCLDCHRGTGHRPGAMPAAPASH